MQETAGSAPSKSRAGVAPGDERPTVIQSPATRVFFVDDRAYSGGSIHCAVNVAREIPEDLWWTS